MSNKTGAAIRGMREIIGITQSELAALIGASKDTVASWESGRNKLSRPFARRISLATGVSHDDLLRGRRELTTFAPASQSRVAFTAETYRQHRERLWGSSDDAAAERHARNCGDALELILVAAMRKQDGTLPAVLDSFLEWCERTRTDFDLAVKIEKELATRRSEFVLNQRYGEWRRKLKEDPEVCRLMGFKDDPKKHDDEYLRLRMETVPVWRPGFPMRGKR